MKTRESPSFCELFVTSHLVIPKTGDLVRLVPWNGRSRRWQISSLRVQGPIVGFRSNSVGTPLICLFNPPYSITVNPLRCGVFFNRSSSTSVDLSSGLISRVVEQPYRVLEKFYCVHYSCKSVVFWDSHPHDSGRTEGSVIVSAQRELAWTNRLLILVLAKSCWD